MLANAGTACNAALWIFAHKGVNAQQVLCVVYSDLRVSHKIKGCKLPVLLQYLYRGRFVVIYGRLVRGIAVYVCFEHEVLIAP